MGGTCDTNASNSEIAIAVLTIPQTINTNNMTGTITYIYHTHESSCYQTCGKSLTKGLYTASGSANEHWYVSCPTHDTIMTWSTSTANSERYCANYYDSVNGKCPKSVLICGRADGELTGATITY